jgi:EAL domain-containing protein (putative c-di-GMP-specific phosphodiesterase class I)
VRLAAGLGMVAVAEGVEDREQLDAVVDEGCTLAQGYHLGRAMAAERFAARVLESNREVVSARR